MLTVPDRIKELLHYDSCKKNIRIHFPNGERSDICNDLIVKDTVSFTESLCSQDTLKFGLCEASVFECETVGVGNIKGATIEVTCEVYCESDVEDAVWQMDLQAWVYAIPYGTFYVDSCQRQADMIHRKIVAYGSTSQLNSSLGSLEQVKFKWQFSTSKTYTPNLFKFTIGNFNMQSYSDDVFNASELTGEDRTDVSYTPTWGHGQYRCKITEKYIRWEFDNDFPLSDLNNLFILEGKQDMDPYDLAKKVNKMFRRYGYNEADDYVYPSAFGYRIDYSVNNPYWNNPFVQFYNTNQRLPFVFYPYAPSVWRCYIEIPYYYLYEIQYYNDVRYLWETVAGVVVDDLTKNIALKKLVEKSGAFDNYTLTFNTQKIGSYYILESLPTDFDNVEYLNALLEIKGNLGIIDRHNGFNMLDIKQQFGLLPETDLYPDTELFPEGVTGGKLFPKDYQTCWYEDEYSKPYGVVQCTYKDSNNADNFYIYYLTGYDEDTPTDEYKVYDLSDNKIITDGVWTQLQIQAICERIANNIEGVTYMPVDFVGRGLPYVEAGDTFEILTKSNDSITTIVLNHTITGEMTLTDSYKSV